MVSNQKIVVLMPVRYTAEYLHFCKNTVFLMFNLCLEWMCKGFIYAEVGGYSATTPEQKASVERRKKEIGPLILERLHVHAFSVRQGSGTSNSGVKSIMEFNYYLYHSLSKWEICMG